MTPVSPTCRPALPSCVPCAPTQGAPAGHAHCCAEASRASGYKKGLPKSCGSLDPSGILAQACRAAVTVLQSRPPADLSVVGRLKLGRYRGSRHSLPGSGLSAPHPPLGHVAEREWGPAGQLPSRFLLAACPQGRFGAGCTHLCRCGQGVPCDPVTGTCICPPGRIGVRCERGEHLCPLPLALQALLTSHGAPGGEPALSATFTPTASMLGGRVTPTPQAGSCSEPPSRPLAVPAAPWPGPTPRDYSSTTQFSA